MAISEIVGRATETLQRGAIKRKTGKRAASEYRNRAGAKNLKKKGYDWKRTRAVPPAAVDPELVAQKHKDLQKLKEWQQAGLICLLYLDESGCYGQGLTGYAYEKRGKQKCIPQNR